MGININVVETNVKNCINTAKINGITQTKFIKMVGEIYNPYTSKFIKFASPIVMNKAANAMQPYATQTQMKSMSRGGKTQIKIKKKNNKKKYKTRKR